MHAINRYRTGRLMSAGLIALALVAWSAGSAANGKENLIVGTTDTLTTLDPAKCYNYWCALVFRNVGETLLGYVPGSTELTPLLAAEMPTISDDGLTYTFKLREGVTFHDGSKMTSEDVKFSLNRAHWIDHPEGAAFLLDGIKSIGTPTPYKVVIHLNAPDITFPSKLAYVVATIVPADAYPSPKGPLSEDAPVSKREEFIKEDFIGTGAYKIVDFREDQSMLMVARDDYWGKQPKNEKVLTRFYAKSPQLLVALKTGEIDVAFRHLTPEQRRSIKNSNELKVIEGEGAAIRFLVFNPRLEPAGDIDVRRAIAAAIDRERIVENVFAGAGQPLYTMVPPGFEASVPTFKKRYEGKKASDFIDSVVPVTLWYSPRHYGDTESALAQTIVRTLEETGLFDVTLKSSEWAQFTANALPSKTGQYPVFLLGWYPDYLDPDDYLSPFYHSEHSFLRMYDSEKMDRLLQQEQMASAPASEERMQTFAEIQRLAAKDVPTLPLYVVTPFAYARENVEGIQQTMGPAQIFRFSVIHKTGE